MARLPMGSFPRRFGRLFLSAVALLASAPHTPLSAQETSAFQVGARIRVWSSAPETTGRVARVLKVRSDTLLLEAERPLAQLAVPVRTLTRLELSRGRGAPVAGTVVGLVVGVAAGAAAGALVGALSVAHARSSNNCPDGNCGFVYLGTVPAGALVGLVAGAVVGHRLGREHWTAVPLPLRP
jgi:hypothetical protein